MSLVIKCYKCKCELHDPAALVFSPPNPRGDETVRKFHVCGRCWWDLLQWLCLERYPEHPDAR